MIPRILKWTVTVVALAIAVAWLRDPVFWKRYFVLIIHGIDEAPLSFFEPRVLVEGAESSGPPRVHPEQQQVDPAALQAAADYAAQFNSNALIVSRRSHIVFEKYWHDTGPDTLSHSHAFGQTVAALMIGIALDDKKTFSIDDPASRYIKEWSGDARDQIRVRDLLQMSSGLRPPAGGSFPWSDRVRALIDEDIVARHMERMPEDPPGKRWVRQNVDPQMLALIVERVTGTSYAKYVSERLWKRIGAGDAYLWLDRPGGTAHADCCMLARQADWMRLAEVLTHDGVYLGEEIVRPGWVRQMLTPAKGNVNFGYQVWIGSPFAAEREQTQSMEPYAVDDVFLMDGGPYRLWLAPSLQLAILRTGPGAPDDKDWDDSRIPNLIIRGLKDYKPPADTAPFDPSKLVPSH